MTVPASIRFRKHARLRDFDYTASHAYFVRICVRGRECVFGSINGGVQSFSRRGIVARDCWLDISNQHPNVELDAFVIMPNHVHGVLQFVGDPPVSVGATPASRVSVAVGPMPGSLGAVIGSYKSAVTQSINRLRAGAGSNLWQPNYHDHIIRNDWSHERIRDYITTNPDRWIHDGENPTGDATDDVERFIRSLEQRDKPLRGTRDAGVAPTGETRA